MQASAEFAYVFLAKLQQNKRPKAAPLKFMCFLLDYALFMTLRPQHCLQMHSCTYEATNSKYIIAMFQEDKNHTTRAAALLKKHVCRM